VVAAVLLGGWLAAGSLLATPEPRLADPAAARARLAQGDAAWERRAEGFRGGLAEPGPIAAAVAAYEAALRLDPSSAEASYKLLQAIWFQGEYATAESATAMRRRLYDHSHKMGERAIDALARRHGGRRRLDALSVAEAARALRGEPWVAPLFLAASCHWALWAQTSGPVAAVRTGALGKARRYTLVSLALDGRFLDGAGYRMLGVLNTKTPHVPLLSGWVDRDRGLAALRRAVELFPHEPINRLFLAEAMVTEDAGDAEARRLLLGLTTLQPRPQWLVEDVTIRRRAGELLARAQREPTADR